MSEKSYLRDHVRESMSERGCQRDQVREIVSQTLCQRDCVTVIESESLCQRDCVRENVAEGVCEKMCQRACQRASVSYCHWERVHKHDRDSVSVSLCQSGYHVKCVCSSMNGICLDITTSLLIANIT